MVKCPKCESDMVDMSRIIADADVCVKCLTHFDAFPKASVPETSPKGVKHDDSKPAMQFIPKSAMWAMGDAYAYGAKKYGAWNYKNGLAVCRCLAAAVRHIYQFLAGENNDPESGKSHLGHALASIGMAIDMVENYPELDDRFKKDA